MSKQELLWDRAKGGFICALYIHRKPRLGAKGISLMSSVITSRSFPAGLLERMGQLRPSLSEGITLWGFRISEMLWSFRISGMRLTVRHTARISRKEIILNGKLPRRKHWFQVSCIFFFLQHVERSLFSCWTSRQWDIADGSLVTAPRSGRLPALPLYRPLLPLYPTVSSAKWGHDEHLSPRDTWKAKKSIYCKTFGAVIG